MRLKLKPVVRYERDIQKDILAMLEIHPSVAWAHRMNVGAHSVANPRTGKSRFVRYGFVGMSDILGQMKNGQFLAIEVKRPGNTPTEDQHAFLDAVSAAGGVSGWADNLDDAIKIVEGKQ